MLKKNKLIVLAICFSFSSVLLASECEKLNVRWIEAKKTVQKSENICVKGERASSEDCEPLIKASCPFSSIKKGKPFSEMIQPIGSPGFNLCHGLEGIPQIYEIKIGKDWKSFERCFWKNSHSFVDISELINFYKVL